MSNIKFTLDIFLSHASEDTGAAQDLYQRLRNDGFENAWLDTEKLRPGQDWKLEITKAIKKSDIFIVLLSPRSVTKTGFLQKEIKLALEVADDQPEGAVFIIPLKIEDCNVPTALEKYQWANYYSKEGYEKLLQTVQKRARDTGKFEEASYPSFSTKEKFPATRYQVGDKETDVYMELLDSGLKSFDKTNLTFQYEHQWMPVPGPIEEHREAWLAEEKTKAPKAGFFNGPCVRLHSIDKNPIQAKNGQEEMQAILYFQPTCWFDYLISNRTLNKEILVPGKGRTTVREAYASEETLVDEGNVDWIQLSNILTVTDILYTNDGWTLIGRRTKSVSDSAGFYATSAAENMHRWKDEPSKPNDPWSTPKFLTHEYIENKEDDVTEKYQPLGCPNPFFTAVRGLYEEVSREVYEKYKSNDKEKAEKLGKEAGRKLIREIDFNKTKVSFLNLAWNMEFFQPHLFAFIELDLSIYELMELRKACTFSDKEAHLIPVRFEPDGELKNILLNGKWATISQAAILRALVHVHGHQDVAKSLRK